MAITPEDYSDYSDAPSPSEEESHAAADFQAAEEAVAQGQLQLDLISDADIANLVSDKLRDKLIANLEERRKALRIAANELIELQKAGYSFNSGMRYVNLVFLPSYNYPETGYLSATTPQTGGAVDYYDAPVVEIYGHTPAAPEFTLADVLIQVRDVTGDGYGFEETLNTYSTSTSTFNTQQTPGNNPVIKKVRLDRRIFDNSTADCYADPRKYELHFASGHVETVENIYMPSPCFQNFRIDNDLNSDVYHYGWWHSYCTNEDYRSWRHSHLNTILDIGSLVLARPHKYLSNSKFAWPGSPDPVFSMNNTVTFDVSTYSEYAHVPNLGVLAQHAYALGGGNLQTTINGTVEYGSPLQNVNPQQTVQDILILPRKYWALWAKTAISYSNVNNTFYSLVDGGLALLDAIKTATGTANILMQNGSYSNARPMDGEYGVVRQYVYAEGLSDCTTVRPIELEVCTDSNSPSYYLTTEEDCNGTSITNYINGSNGINWMPIAGPAGCCTVDCSTFNMLFTDADSAYNGNNGTITIDFTNGTGSSVGAPNTTANQHDYTVQITHSTGASITQNGGSTYTIGGSFSDSTCDTASGSSIVACNANTAITVGMSVTGTGVTGTAYVGAITGGTPGAVTGFQLSSTSDINTPVNSSGAQTNTTLTFAVGPTRFVWGSLAPTTGGSHYVVKVTDGAGCIAESLHFIDEETPIIGCTDNTAINYAATNQQACVPDCCLFCDTSSGNIIDGNSGFISELSPTTSYSSTPVSTISSTDGSLSVLGSLYSGAAGFVVSTMSYKYTIYALTSWADFSSAGTALSSTTSTLAQGINKTFSSLGYGFYGIKVEIEDSATGSDAGLEKCFIWIPAMIQTPVCTDTIATNYSTYASVDPMLQIVDNSICTYPVGCSCGVDMATVILTGCSPSVKIDVSCQPVGSQNASFTWDWKDSSGNVLTSGTQANVVNTMIIIGSNNIPGAGVYTFEMIDNSNASGCITVHTVNVNLPICGCTDPTAMNYNPSATIDNGSCVYCVYGCTDPTALNFNSTATCDDGSCNYPIYGCTDPTASNYDPTATSDDGSCLYSGCLDPTAMNYMHDCNNLYNASINVNDQNCCNYCVAPTVSTLTTTATSVTTGCIGNSDGEMSISAFSNNSCSGWDLSVSNNSGTVVFTATNIQNTDIQSTGTILAPGVYTYIITDNCTACSTSGTFTIGTTPATCGCTDPNAINYDPNATNDDGSCEYAGCMDPTASNYNPNAVQDDGSCNYIIASNPCTLPNVEYNNITNALQSCLTLKGATYLQKIKIGYADDCSIMNQWKLLLVNYLLAKKDLDCIYNCSDAMTSVNTTVTSDCTTLATTGGSVTGVNDQGYAGSTYSTATGTVITDPSLYFVAGNILYPGDVITMPSGLIWEMVAGGSCTNGCYNPETSQGATSGHWIQCTESSTWSTEESTNYLDPFMKFMNEMCSKCVTDPNCLTSRQKENIYY